MLNHPDLNQDLLELFNNAGQQAFYRTHYEWADATGFMPQQWKEFLSHPAVSDYISIELRIIQENELRKLLKDISSSGKDRSVGLAQIVTSLTKVLDTKQKKEGPVFVYCYVPLTKEESHAENINVLTRDPFIIPE